MAKVLVVDDDAAIRMLLARWLAKHAFEIDQASDGVEAVERIEANLPHLILLDIMMPRMNGFGVVAHLRKAHPSLLQRTIVMTAAPRDAENELDGICKLVPKPFEMQVMLEIIRTCAAAK
ncbi:MAG TPA: response regulator [Thermoanaerobaculia bacterium]|nr:response regulator [Thermoanaerobaculia bacterium]